MQSESNTMQCTKHKKTKTQMKMHETGKRNSCTEDKLMKKKTKNKGHLA